MQRAMARAAQQDLPAVGWYDIIFVLVASKGWLTYKEAARMLHAKAPVSMEATLMQQSFLDDRPAMEEYTPPDSD